MKKIALNEAQKFERDACLTHEYPFYALNIDACYARVTGRNPVSGFEYNEESTEVVFIIAGSGEISTGGGTISFTKGDVIMIGPMEKYFWTEACNCEMFISCNPPWSADKHKYVDK